MISDINFAGKKVLIVGGGRLALRKAKQFQKEGAIVEMIAPEFFGEFDTVSVTKLQRAYEENDCLGYFCVYACTDNKALNHQIVGECSRNNILAASIHSDDEAGLHAMKQCEQDGIRIGCNTGGVYPALPSSVLEDMKLLLEELYGDRMQALGELRKAVLETGIAHDEKRKFLKHQVKASGPELQFYQKALKSDYAVVFAFHGVKNDEAVSEIQKFIEKLPDGIPAYFGFLSDEMVSCINAPVVNAYEIRLKKQRVLSFEELCEQLFLLKKKIICIPMLLHQGFYYEKMKKTANKYEADIHPVFEEELLRQLLDDSEDCQQIVMMHASKDREFKGLLERLNDNPLRYICTSLEEVKALPLQEKVKLIGFYVLSGNHLQKEIFGEKGSVASYLKERGCHVIENSQMLIEHPVMLSWLRENL